jgi:hypothetical protein
MNTILSNSHPSIDLVAEGMWKIAAGESCPECWEMLPEQQKEWWRSCATRAVGDWMSCARDADLWGRWGGCTTFGSTLPTRG